MITSIGEMCRKNGKKLNDTVYEKSCRSMLEFKIVSGDFYEFVEKKSNKDILCYKNCLEVMDFPMVKEQLPQIADVKYPNKDDFPYFVSGLSMLSEKIDRGEKVAVEGGPCLFGTNEVTIEVQRKDGRKDYFDYNTGKVYSERGQDAITIEFGKFVTENAEEIREIHFENRKKGLTPQEWAFIKYPFEIAKEFSAPLVIPIPDLSYVKYLDAVLKGIDKRVRADAIAEFRDVAYEITDMYLDVIEQMRRINRNVYCEVLHEREKELCKKYYEERSLYIERNRIIRNLTGIPEKVESIKDYVSMPALPYYLFGIENVLEVDSMDEADSFRKCRKAHKGSLNLSCILYPELLSSDMVHTIFDAPQERKRYGEYVVE